MLSNLPRRRVQGSEGSPWKLPWVPSAEGLFHSRHLSYIFRGFAIKAETNVSIRIKSGLNICFSLGKNCFPTSFSFLHLGCYLLVNQWLCALKALHALWILGDEACLALCPASPSPFSSSWGLLLIYQGPLQMPQSPQRRPDPSTKENLSCF